MDVLEALNTRATAVRLDNPAPAREQMAKILEAGTHAPDHGKLAPWRFIVIENEAREVLANAMVESLKRRNPEVPAAEVQRERDKVYRAPVIVTVGVKPVDKGDKIPEIEQVLSAGAAAQNIFLAANALGFGVMWKTGGAAYDPIVKRALGLEERDHIVAFLYIGTPVVPGQPRKPNTEGRIRYL